MRKSKHDLAMGRGRVHRGKTKTDKTRQDMTRNLAGLGRETGLFSFLGGEGAKKREQQGNKWHKQRTKAGLCWLWKGTGLGWLVHR